MNKKQRIRINENQLRKIVTESVKRVLNETSPERMAAASYGRQQQAQGLRPLSPSMQRKGMKNQDMQGLSDKNRNSAVSAWNNEFGSKNRFMRNDYSVVDTGEVNGFHGDTPVNSKTFDTYDPNTDTKNKKWFQNGKEMDNLDIPNYSSQIGDGDKGVQTSRKMALAGVNEAKLKQIVTESVKKVLKETLNEDRGIPEDSEDWEDYMTNCPRDSKNRPIFGFEYWKKHGWEYMNQLEKEW